MLGLSFRKNPGGGLSHQMEIHREFNYEQLSVGAGTQGLVRWPSSGWRCSCCLLLWQILQSWGDCGVRWTKETSWSWSQGGTSWTSDGQFQVNHLRALTSDLRFLLSEDRIGSRDECLDECQMTVSVLFNMVATNILRTFDAARLSWGVLYM